MKAELTTIKSLLSSALKDQQSSPTKTPQRSIHSSSQRQQPSKARTRTSIIFNYKHPNIRSRSSTVVTPATPEGTTGCILSTQSQIADIAQSVRHLQAERRVLQSEVEAQLAETREQMLDFAKESLNRLLTAHLNATDPRIPVADDTAVFTSTPNNDNWPGNSTASFDTKPSQISNPSIHLTPFRANFPASKSAIVQLRESLTPRLQDLREVVEELRLDVTLRRVRPSRVHVERAVAESQEIAATTQKLQELLDSVRPDWKAGWEAELQQIVQEQGYLKESERCVGEVEEDCGEVIEVLSALMLVVEMFEDGRKGTGGGENREIAAARFKGVLSTEEIVEGYRAMLEEMKITVDGEGHSERRMRALQRAERLRRWEAAAKVEAGTLTTEFEKELRAVVNGVGGLKNTGGVERVEETRVVREQLMFKDLFASHGV
ncbi:Bud site selection protein 6 [Blyttiomyces sp. JEL0837]|nr:Bud site selection protein 6 [Blyttiomyces sp. JEL0837]